LPLRHNVLDSAKPQLNNWRKPRNCKPRPQRNKRASVKPLRE
jgi:hypothetical protein